MFVNDLILHRKIDFILTDLDEAEVYCIQNRIITKLLFPQFEHCRKRAILLLKIQN